MRKNRIFVLGCFSGNQLQRTEIVSSEIFLAIVPIVLNLHCNHMYIDVYDFLLFLSKYATFVLINPKCPSV